MSNLHRQRRRGVSQWSTCAGILCIAVTLCAEAAVLESDTADYFGTFDGVDYIRYAGRFSGETAKGHFRVPFEIVAPADPADGNRTVVFEPPHFQFGAGGRDSTFGVEFLFGRGFRHATVGFGEFFRNILDPEAEDAVIGGEPVSAKMIPGVRDVEILKQFAEALSTDPYALNMLGQVKRKYAFGVSQSAEALFEIQYGQGAAGLFDLTILQLALWRPVFAEPAVLAVLPEQFSPLADIGKVMLVASEGDQIITGSAPFRDAVEGPDAQRNYRLYEVAGAPHLALDIQLDPTTRTNPLGVEAIVRAALVAGHRWVRRGIRPPRSRLLVSASHGEVDPVYGFETGIARDANLNARGGIRFPDVAIGRALFVASSSAEIVPGFPGLAGVWFDRACARKEGTDRPRFRSHKAYVKRVARRALRLVRRGYLLPIDATSLIHKARESDVGRPGACDMPD